MILKVENETAGYDLWDSIDSIRVHRAVCKLQLSEDEGPPYECFYKEVGKTDKGETKLTLMGEPTCIIIREPNRDSRGWLTLVKRHGSVFSIYFDTSGYLLNDEGKTIETYR